MAKPVHSMIRVFDEARSLDYYKRAFGLDVADHLKFSDFALIYLRHPSSPFELELTVNFDRKEPYALGDGYGHMAFVIDDIHTEHERFQAVLAELLGRPAPADTRADHDCIKSMIA